MALADDVDRAVAGRHELLVGVDAEAVVDGVRQILDAEKKLMSPGDRPIDIVREGKTRKELLA